MDRDFESVYKMLKKASNKYKIKFVWVPGHSGHIENERCDELAVDASTHEELEVDVYFENSRKETPSLFN